LLGLDPHRQVFPAKLRVIGASTASARRSFSAAISNKIPMLRAMLVVVGSMRQLL
jgi:hypothetical protein